MTNNELKQEILRVLSELVEHCPDIRFGQLMVNLSCIARGPTPEAVKTHLKDHERRPASVA